MGKRLSDLNTKTRAIIERRRIALRMFGMLDNLGRKYL